MPLPPRPRISHFADVTPLVPTKTRQVSLNELESETVFIVVDADGNYVLNGEGNVSECDPEDFTPETAGDECVPFGPTDAKVGILADDPFSDDDGEGYVGIPLMWTDMTGASTMVKVFTMANGTPVMVPVTEMPNSTTPRNGRSGISRRTPIRSTCIWWSSRWWIAKI